MRLWAGVIGGHTACGRNLVKQGGLLSLVAVQPSACPRFGDIAFSPRMFVAVNRLGTALFHAGYGVVI